MATTTTTTNTLPSMYGVYNEPWYNHPAGLPQSRYRPNTNPNRGQTWGSATTPAKPAIPAVPRTGTTPTTPARPATPAKPATGTGTIPGLTSNRGFASRYTPAQLREVYDSPWTILPDVFRGIQTSSPGYQALRDLGGDPLALFNIIQGSQGKLGGGADQFTNFMADLYKNMGTPGGKGFDARGMIDAIFSQQTGEKANTSLGQILSAGDMGQQIRTLFNLLRDVSSVGMNPLAARGYQAALAQAGDRYGNAQMSAPANQTQSIVEWINKNTPGLALR